MKSSDDRVKEHRKLSVPHGVQVEHGRLQLSQLDGSDADSPDVTQLVVAAVLLHRCHFWSHPEEKETEQNSARKHYTPFLTRVSEYRRLNYAQLSNTEQKTKQKIQAVSFSLCFCSILDA